MEMSFIEVAIKAEVEAGDLLSLLEDGRNLGCWEEGDWIHVYWPQDAWEESILDDIKNILRILNRNPDDAVIEVRAIEDRDWNATWTASLAPIRLGRNLRIRQSWHPPDPLFEGIELVLDPKRAFGTGYHASTQLILEWLEDTIAGRERVLDIGTGSGILSMAAVRLGAESALAVDIDAVAVGCAREYASLNGLEREIEFRVASFEQLAEEFFDVVVANIDGRTLPSLCPHLPRLMKVQGTACFSGLQLQDLPEISSALEDAGFKIKAERHKGEWMALEIVAL